VLVSRPRGVLAVMPSLGRNYNFWFADHSSMVSLIRWRSSSSGVISTSVWRRRLIAASWWPALWSIQAYWMWTSGRLGVRAIVFPHRAWSFFHTG
jgi:hypothetical protein